MKSLLFLAFSLAQLVAPVWAHNKDDYQTLISTNKCVECDLTGVNLAGADLSNANLTGADLTGANLFKVNLSGTKLYQTLLISSDLLKALKLHV